jgi:hypothetical protein
MAHWLTLGWRPANIQQGVLIGKLADSEEHIFYRNGHTYTIKYYHDL